MTENKYSIENLVDTFLKHHEEVKSREYYSDEFDITLALHEMCKEIVKLKNFNSSPWK